MSVVVCDHCETYIDSDKDCDCFIVNPYDLNDITTLCEPCREKAYDRQQESLMETGGGPSLIEQQREAWNLK